MHRVPGRRVERAPSTSGRRPDAGRGEGIGLWRSSRALPPRRRRGRDARCASRRGGIQRGRARARGRQGAGAARSGREGLDRRAMRLYGLDRPRQPTPLLLALWLRPVLVEGLGRKLQMSSRTRDVAQDLRQGIAGSRAVSQVEVDGADRDVNAALCASPARAETTRSAGCAAGRLEDWHRRHRARRRVIFKSPLRFELLLDFLGHVLRRLEDGVVGGLNRNAFFTGRTSPRLPPFSASGRGMSSFRYILMVPRSIGCFRRVW